MYQKYFFHPILLLFHHDFWHVKMVARTLGHREHEKGVLAQLTEARKGQCAKRKESRIKEQGIRNQGTLAL